MTKTAQVKFIGTPKGKSKSKYHELSNLCASDEEWVEYYYSCYDSPFWEKEQLDKIRGQIPAYKRLQEYMAEFVDVYENSML